MISFGAWAIGGWLWGGPDDDAAVRAIHKAGSSDLIFGQYRTPDAAQSDLRRAQAFKAPGSGQQIYRLARLIDVPGAKIGPPELDLANTTRGDYTVQIAVYIDDPKQNAYGRKRSAVERAKQLRQEGWDAYYFHGSTRSAVCIGLFGPESVKLKKSELAIVENRAVDPMAEQFILIDPKLQDIMAKFPKLAVNDREEWITSWNTKTGKNDMAPIESCVIKIPRPVIRTPLPVPTPESPYPVGTPPR